MQLVRRGFLARLQLGASARLTVTFAVVLSAATAVAAPPDDSTAKAKHLYDDAVTDYNLGHYDEALASFEQAYRIRHDPVFLFNIGQCERQLHRYEDAERSYRAYLRESTELPQTTREQVQKLVTEMNAASQDARAKQPQKVKAPPEPHAESPPVITRRGTEGVTPSDERVGRTKMVAGVAVAAFGVAAIAAGGGFYAVASSANDRLNHPSNGVYSESAENSRDTFQSLDIAAFVMGGVALLTGTTLAVLGWRQRHRLTFMPTTTGNPVGATLNVGF